MTIRLGVCKHPIIDGKCKQSMDKTKMLIAKEVDRTPNEKIFMISPIVSKTLVRYIFNDYSDGIVEVFNGE
jgi:hypothetical protein